LLATVNWHCYSILNKNAAVGSRSYDSKPFLWVYGHRWPEKLFTFSPEADNLQIQVSRRSKGDRPVAPTFAVAADAEDDDQFGITFAVSNVYENSRPLLFEGFPGKKTKRSQS
jgi:hypothetical protein